MAVARIFASDTRSVPEGDVDRPRTFAETGGGENRRSFGVAQAP